MADILVDLQALKDFGDLKDAKYTAQFAPLNSVNSIYHYKGSVNDYAGLPINSAEIGDVYNVVNADTARGIKAGDNLAWNGTAWDNLSGTVDLSNYVEKDGNKVLSDYSYTFEEKVKVAGVETNAQVNKIESIKLNGVELTIGADKSVDIVGVGTGNGDVESVNGQTGAVVLDIPSKVSDLVNDSNFVTSNEVTTMTANFATSAEVQAITAGTSAVGKAIGDEDGSNIKATYATKTELQQATINAGANGVTSINGQSGIVVIDIPTKTSELTNDSNFVTTAYLQTNAVTVAQATADANGNDIVATYSTKAETTALENLITALQAQVTQLEQDLAANTAADAVQQQSIDNVVDNTTTNVANTNDIGNLFP